VFIRQIERWTDRVIPIYLLKIGLLGYNKIYRQMTDRWTDD